MSIYKKLITKFLDEGYESTFFSPLPSKKRALILRHDIDFDIEYADKISRIEDEIGVKSIFFFLMHSKSYNLLENKNYLLVKSMMDRGHQVSIHFDPTLYDDIEKGFDKERKLFETVFDTEVKYTSIHRPSEYFINNPNKICGVSHTYQPTYFKNIKYFSDSQGEFKYGHPHESKEFSEKQTMQLLTHPIWWVTKSKDPISKLEEFLDYRVNSYKEHIADNCIPYRDYLENK